MNEIAAYLPPLHQKLAVIVLTLSAALWIVRLVRMRQMREEHALLWFLGLAGGGVVIWSDGALILITRALGVEVPASALLLLTLFFLFIVTVKLTTEVSRQKEQIVKLVIAVSLLQERSPGADE